MLRDANVNNGKPLFDTVPERYMFKPETVDYKVAEWTYKSWDDYKIKQSDLVNL